MSYGVQPTGYVRKPLSVILAELEAGMVTEFGPGVIQTPQSPLGQLNGLMADLIAELWELAEDVYQSYDPDQAEGTRLETLGRLRLVKRDDAETDAALRQAITNTSTARISLADLLRAVRSVTGVSFARVFVNETLQEDPSTGMSPNTVAVAVLGGTDSLIAEVITQYVTPGVSTFGNVPVTTLEDGYCRNVRIVRPQVVLTEVTLRIRVMPDRFGCPPPSSNAVREAVRQYLTDLETRPFNGQSITPHFIRTHLERLFPNVEVLDVIGTKDGTPETEGGGIHFTFMQIADVTKVTVEVV